MYFTLLSTPYVYYPSPPLLDFTSNVTIINSITSDIVSFRDISSVVFFLDIILIMFLLFIFSSTLWPHSLCCQAFPLVLFFVISELNGKPVVHTAECCRLHLPVVHRVFKQADAVIVRPLHPEPSGAEVVHAHLTDVVGVEVHHLKNKARR